jgi:hypothetical protein
MKDREENLEKLLSAAPQIDDNGFTENLMLRLPPQRDILRIRTTILLAFSFAACAIVAAVPGARQFLAEFVSGFASSSVVADLSLLTTAVLTALLIWGAVAAATSDA